jgi:uncharacterized protein YjiK
MHQSDRVAFQFDGMFDIPHVRRDASALTIHCDSGHLWTITDDNVLLVEFTTQGRFIREVKLKGFDDAEGLCHVSGDRFLIAEEKKMCISLIDVPPDATSLTAHGRCIQLDAKSKKNKGLEGISYDARTNTLFAIREDKPPAVYRVQPLLGEGQPTVKEWSLDLDGLDDLSDTFFDAAAGWLWLVSHESQAAVAFDSQGVRVIEMRLKKGCHGLPKDIEQAEGIVRDREGALYICSEPNQVYRFRPTE